jgi:hypothetical protein
MHFVPAVPTLWIPGSAARPRNDEHGVDQCTLASMQMRSTLRVDDGAERDQPTQ